MPSHPNLDANGKKIVAYVLCVSAISALLQGYAQAMMNGINLLPAYINYFNLTTTSSLYALNVSVIYLGTLCSTPFATYIANHWGRKWGLRIAAFLGVLGALLQTAAVHESMFMIARFIIGMAINTGYVVAPTYLSEVMHPDYRVLMVGFGAASWYLGSIVASFVTYGSQYIDSGASNWTWRLPSLLQLLPSILCFAFIHLVPESPRWLVYHDRAPEALEILVKYHGNGDPESPVVALEYQGIVEALRLERETQSLGWKEFLRTPQNRKRGVICAGLGIMTYWSGNNIVAYYLGDILIAASITGVSTQLAVNIGLAFWGYVVAVFSSFLSNRMGRRPIFLGSNIGMAICMLIQGLLTKHYTTGTESFTPASSGAIVFITFVFNAAYNMALTPLGYVYPTEVCSYSLRANGLGLNSFVAQTAGFAAAYWTPYAMKKAWIYYLVVAVWDVLQAVFVWFVFVETKGLSLEEVEGLFVDVDGGREERGRGVDNEVAKMEEGELGERKGDGEDGSGSGSANGNGNGKWGSFELRAWFWLGLSWVTGIVGFFI